MIRRKSWIIDTVICTTKEVLIMYISLGHSVQFSQTIALWYAIPYDSFVLEVLSYALLLEKSLPGALSRNLIWLSLSSWLLDRLELRDEWRLENRKAFANIWSDMVFGVSLFILLYFYQSQVSYHQIICSLLFPLITIFLLLFFLLNNSRMILLFIILHLINNYLWLDNND